MFPTVYTKTVLNIFRPSGTVLKEMITKMLFHVSLLSLNFRLITFLSYSARSLLHRRRA